MWMLSCKLFFGELNADSAVARVEVLGMLILFIIVVQSKDCWSVESSGSH